MLGNYLISNNTISHNTGYNNSVAGISASSLGNGSVVTISNNLIFEFSLKINKACVSIIGKKSNVSLLDLVKFSISSESNSPVD